MAGELHFLKDIPADGAASPRGLDCSAWIEANVAASLRPAGPVMDEQNNFLGDHPGIVFFEWGPMKFPSKDGEELDLQVKSLDPKRAVVKVGALVPVQAPEMVISEVSWIHLPKQPLHAMTVDVQFLNERFGLAHRAPFTFFSFENKVIRGVVQQTVVPEEFQPGISVAFFDGNECLGGGVLDRWIR